MRIIAAYLLAVLGGNDAPKSEDITRFCHRLVSKRTRTPRARSLQAPRQNDRRFDRSGYSKLASVGMGGGGGGGAAAVYLPRWRGSRPMRVPRARSRSKPRSEGKKEEKKKKDEEEEVDEDMGSIFGDDDEGY